MGKYDKYICTTLHKRDRLPGPSPRERDHMADIGLRWGMEHLLWLDEDIIPGAYYGELTWIWPNTYPGQATQEWLRANTTNMAPMFPHGHGFPEILSWYGSDPDDPDDNANWGMIMGDEEVALPTSWVGYIPADMLHMPTRRPGVKPAAKPVSHWTAGPGVYLRGTEGHDAQAAKQQDLPVPGKPRLKTRDTLRYFILAGSQQDVKRPAYMRPWDHEFIRPMAYIDDTVIPDAEFGCDAMFLMPGPAKKTEPLMEAHTLPHGTMITLTAMNYEDLTGLDAEVEFYIGGEKHVLNKTFGAYVPPNVAQGPLVVRGIKKQMFLNVTHPVGAGIKKYRGG